MIPVRFLSPALEEVANALQELLEKSPRAARRFDEEMDHVLDLIASNPHIGRPATGETRKFTLHSFSYDVIYKLIEGEAVIYALANHKRKPGYWLDRL